MANDNDIQPVADDSQIVLYQPDDSIRCKHPTPILAV